VLWGGGFLLRRLLLRRGLALRPRLRASAGRFSAGRLFGGRCFAGQLRFELVLRERGRHAPPVVALQWGGSERGAFAGRAELPEQLPRPFALPEDGLDPGGERNRPR